MTLQSSQFVVLLTKPDAASGYVAAQDNPNASWGGFASKTPVASGSSNNLFAPVDAAGAEAGQTDYACVAIANLSGADTAQGVAVAIVDAAGGGVYSIGLDPVGIVSLTSVAAQGTSIGSAFAAPAGVTFSSGPLVVGNLPPNMCVLVWVRCVLAAGTPGTAADACDISATATTS